MPAQNVVLPFRQLGAQPLVRRVSVNRARTPHEMLDATKRYMKLVTESVVEEMPREGDKETEVHFFNLGRPISDANLADQFKLRNFRPDPYAQGAVNEAEPKFADEYPNGGHWQNKRGVWCFIGFYPFDQVPVVIVHERDFVWPAWWYFAGVPM